MNNELVSKAMTIKLDNVLPEYPKILEGYRRAPDRGFRLTKAQAELALRNALRGEIIPRLEAMGCMVSDFLKGGLLLVLVTVYSVFTLWLVPRLVRKPVLSK